MGQAPLELSVSALKEANVALIRNKCALRRLKLQLGSIRSTGDSGGSVTQRRHTRLYQSNSKGIIGSFVILSGLTLALLCVLKFGGKSIGFGGKVQPASSFIYIKRSLKEDLL